MRLPPLLVPGLALTLAIVAILADRAIVGQARAERTASRLRIDEDAERSVQAVIGRLVRFEQTVLARRPTDAGRVERLAAPPPASVPAPGRPAFAALSRPELAERLSSSGATPNGLPEAVVARLALGPAAARPAGARSVVDRLLAGELPVRVEDLAYLSERLGLRDDPRVAALAARLRSIPDSEVPGAPAFRRRASGTRVEGWSRTADGFLVRYDLPIERLLSEAASPGGPILSAEAARAESPEPDAAPSRRIEVSGVDGLVLSVRPRPVDGLRVAALRIVLWLSAAVGIVALVALQRSVIRETKAMDRERAFLAGVTHELRTPLTSIRVLGETLAGGRGTPREYGSLIAEESQRLEALVERVLTLARLDEAVRPEPVDPGELVRSTLPVIAPRARKVGARVECRVEADLPECRWDADAVRRALINLLDNALRHGRRDGVVVASARREDDAVRVSVADDGPGIGKGDRRRIFGRFERGRTEAPGTGLGLFLVEAVARAHGGRVDLETAAGRGATFSMILPIHPPGERPAPRTVP